VTCVEIGDECRISEEMRRATPRLWGVTPAELGDRVGALAGVSNPSEQAAADTHRERVHLDVDGRFVRIERLYEDGAVNSGCGPSSEPAVHQDVFLVRELIGWVTGEVMPSGVRMIAPDVWAHESALIGDGARFVGPVWIGQGARVDAHATVVGPCVIPDHQARHVVAQPDSDPPERIGTEAVFGFRGARSKRLFDIAASMLVLGATLPLSVFIVAAIWMQAGRPILFSNERQTLGGRSFRCLKFRTMRRDAEQIKAAFSAANTCDGPQFHIPNDPRTFPIGRVLRRCHLDELPQLINVLKGDMSIVGPRPSPDRENQCCPVWRRERLRVRAGITGNWQVNCKRRPGTDFQEWIRYDLEYIRGWSWRLDCSIMCRTLLVAVRRGAGLIMPSNREAGLRTPKASRYVPESTIGVVEPKPERRAEPAAA